MNLLAGQFDGSGSVRVQRPAAGHTLIIPTYNRPNLLSRLARYYAERAQPLQVLVLDSSKPEVARQNGVALASYGACVRHVVYPMTTPMAEKLALGLGLVDTPTVSFCADDDIVFPDGLRQARSFVLEHPDYVCAHGLYLNFREDGFQVHVTREYGGESNEANHPGARIFRLCQSYESLLYGVFRTDDLRDIFVETAKIPSLHYQELFQSVAALIKGKTKRFASFYAGRRTGPVAEPTRDKWQTYYWFADNPTEVLQHYLDYRDRLAQFYAEHAAAPQLDRASFLRVLDITHAIYFSRGCDPLAFHNALQGYWPTDGFVMEPKDLFESLRSLRSISTDGRRGLLFGLLRRITLRNGRKAVAMASQLALVGVQRNVRRLCKHSWTCELVPSLKWLAANKGFRAAFRELCFYLDELPPPPSGVQTPTFRVGGKV